MYQPCPFCNRVFEIGASDYRPMKAHIRARHADEGSGVSAKTDDHPTRPTNTAD